MFPVSGRMFLADLLEGSARELSSPGAVDDPRLDPSGERIAYVVSGALHVREIEGGNRVLATDDDPDVSWGLAEFVAAEEMDRRRGHWWSPDGSMIAAARVDERPVRIWYIADQTDPAAAPRAVRYPQAGTEDAVVTLHLFDVATGDRTDVAWDAAAFPYLGRFHWSRGGPPLVLVVSRDQRRAGLLEIDTATGATTLVRETTDPEWVDLVEEAPARTVGRPDRRGRRRPRDRHLSVHRRRGAGHRTGAPGPRGPGCRRRRLVPSIGRSDGDPRLAMVGRLGGKPVHERPRRALGRRRR